MEPLSTFFRISPALLLQDFTTPRSQSSSSISSPSFADHQTGLKVYSESPASLTSAHQDNPLFEGFPVLPASARKAGALGDAARSENARAPGDSPKLQEQLHHLLAVLQQALELHSRDSLLDGIASKLADEMETVARKLKEKEREMPVERQLRAKLQLALTGAEATIRKLRATPTRGAPASGLEIGWRYNEAATSPTGSCDSADATQVASTARCGGVRDSVCRQLLQSPSSSASPLSWTNPSTAAIIPMCADDSSRASPKELPVDQHRGNCPELVAGARSSCEHVLIPTGIPRPQVSSASSGATSSSFHPPLYNWMKAILASTAKQGERLVRGSSSDGSGTVGRGAGEGSGVESPAVGGAVGGSLASVVRAALSNTRTPPLIYGSPLYRRIRRLLAEQRSPSPCRDATIQSGVMQPCDDIVKGTPTSGRRAGYGTDAIASADTRSMWDRDAETSSESTTSRSSDTSTSCNTPTVTTRDPLSALRFKSSVSPFGPTLRERYAARASTISSHASSVQCPSATLAVPTTAFKATALGGALSPQRGEHSEAAELVAELGLDLQLDPIAAANISNIEVLEHVERWAREQFIAAKRALQASKEAALEDDRGSHSTGSSNCLDLISHAHVGIPMQTESPGIHPAGRAQALQYRAPTPAAPFGEAAVVSTLRWPPKPEREAPAGARRAQFADTSSEAGGCWNGTAGHDTGADVCPLARSDQSKRSPLPVKGYDAATIRGESLRKHSGAAGWASSVAIWARKRCAASEVSGNPSRRGLFRFGTLRGCTAGSKPGTKGDDRLRATEGREHSSSFDLPSSDIPRCPAPSRPRPLPSTDAAIERPVGSIAVLSSAVGPVHMQRPGNQANNARSNYLGPAMSHRHPANEELPPDVLFTPGTSTMAGGKTRTGRHTSRAFPAASCSTRGRTGSRESTTPLSDIRSCSTSSESRAEAGPSAGPVGLGPSFGGDLTPSAPRGPHGPADELSPRTEDLDENAAEVLFTPGNGQSAKSFMCRHKPVPFRLDSATRIEDEETEEGDASAKTLSSISSVSIIGLEPVSARNGDPNGGQRSMGVTQKQAVSRRGGPKTTMSAYLCGFLTALKSCSHGSVAT